MPATHDVSCTAAALPFGARPPGRSLARRRLDIAQACFVVLASAVRSGRLAPCVGIDTAILGVARLRQRHGVDAMLLVAVSADAGADAELARLRDLVRALSMKTHVHFLVPGSTQVLRDCHAAANVLVRTPWCAADVALSHAALACPLPGAVIPPRDAEALASHLARLHRLSGLAQAMAINGGERPAKLAVPDNSALQ
ncbi:glycosyltransferase involved in cell wall biosynthesis [Massilia sp. MP_M2]|uniref:glycosyltransferase n=1 Tax=Massilia sp. MP_M2 TaxID=3071713 RepID=UPI00319DB8D1